MRYPMKITQDGHSFRVSFQDVPEALTQGDTVEEAREHASDALETALEFYFKASESIPLPSPVKRGCESIELPANIAAKVLLLNLMLAEQVRPSELARRMNVTRQEVNRLIDLHHATRIEKVAAAVKVLGKSLELSLA